MEELTDALAPCIVHGARAVRMKGALWSPRDGAEYSVPEQYSVLEQEAGGKRQQGGGEPHASKRIRCSPQDMAATLYSASRQQEGHPAAGWRTVMAAVRKASAARRSPNQICPIPGSEGEWRTGK